MVGLVAVRRRGLRRASGGVFEVEVAAERGCVPGVRRGVREWLERGGGGVAVGELEVVVSELVTNAVLYSGAGSVVVAGRRSCGVVRLEVRDGGRFVPPCGEPDLLATGGRGLVLVGALVEGLGGRWGFVDGVGVWVEVPLSAAADGVNSLRGEG
ncbi:ATP-binding protein [Streptomyces roseirectus]|uniref:ATP-binding protein n=1 Tax=Streptomyces roseirectus TaxID=2768066 RepID=A0A7H0IQ82_9ACTN|nr:ATP-binding protein [Streptomyces roseirectus]QNP74948.1 ATP-binding protein [Streptomyces roseirectus]